MKILFFLTISIICYRYITSKCHVEMARNRSICFNIELEEKERQKVEQDGVIYTPDACCYAWTNYYTVVNIGGREIRLPNNFTYCSPYEKSKIKETIKIIKAKYADDDEIVDFDMFIDCGDKQEGKEEEKEEGKEEEKEEGKEEEESHIQNDTNKGDIKNNLYIILNMCLLLILIL